MTVMERLANSVVVPVVVLEKAEDAVPTARAMAAGGVDTMEITFRTACAPEAIKAVAENCPDVLVGAGTIEPQGLESIKVYRTLPKGSRRFLDWQIQNQKYLHEQHPGKKLVNIMQPMCSGNGNLKLTNDYDIRDISHLGDEGITSYLLMDKDGTIRSKGTAAAVPEFLLDKTDR